MSDHTPSLEEVRAIYASGTPAHHVSIAGSYAEFDRAIAKIRAEAKQEALREAAEAIAEMQRTKIKPGLYPLGFEDSQKQASNLLKTLADKLVTE